MGNLLGLHESMATTPLAPRQASDQRFVIRRRLRASGGWASVTATLPLDGKPRQLAQFEKTKQDDKIWVAALQSGQAFATGALT
jgi:hypothetical protein